MEKKGGKKRKLSAWNIFVKKTFYNGRKKNKSYKFKQALSDSAKNWKKSKKHMKKGGEKDDTEEDEEESSTISDNDKSSDTGNTTDSGLDWSTHSTSIEGIEKNKGGRKSKKSVKKSGKKSKKNRR